MRTIAVLTTVAWLGMIAGVTAAPLSADLSPVQAELQKIRYDISYRALTTEDGRWYAALEAVETDAGFEESVSPGRKSPVKAFLLSLALPGLGQWYNGSRVKPFLFLGAEIAAWGLNRKWHAEGNDKTREFEAFQRAHWSRTDYEQKYLLWAYGVTDDDSLTGPEYPEVSHHLPDGETQQYFEMTGKYDQFLWGWDDAYLVVGTDTTRLSDYNANNPPPRIRGGPDNTPFSARRLIYEGMRKDANDAYDRATKMVIAAMLNRVVSAFEAFVAARKHNRSLHRRFGVLGGVEIKPSLKSLHSSLDTPYLRLTLRF